MKTKFAFTFFKKMMLVLGLVYLNACQKEVSEISPGSIANSEAIAKINAWLSSRKTGSIAVISAVKNNLSFPEMRFEKLSEMENLIIVPIKDGFKSAVNKDKNPTNHLLLIVNKAGKIRKGNIVQFVAPNGVNVKKLPANTFHNFYNADHLVCDGRFTFLNLNDKMLYQMDYANGKLSAYGEKQVKKQNAGTSNVITCTDWYLFTTYFYEDGSTLTTEEYLNTTCSGNGGNQEQESELEDDPYGWGGGGSEVETIMSPTQLDWYVCDLDDYTVSLPNSTEWWQLFSTERLYGTKKASLPGGGKFTQIEHLGETITGQSEFTWHKTGVTIAYEQLTARSIISGTVKKNGTIRANIQSRYHDFAFSSVFP